MLPAHDEFPRRVDLRMMLDQQPLPVNAPGAVDSASMAGEEATRQARAVLDKLNAALAADDTETLKSCFFAGQAYWKDQLALTYHLRTFTNAGVVAASLVETKGLRGLTGGIKLEGAAQFVAATPALVSK